MRQRTYIELIRYKLIALFFQIGLPLYILIYYMIIIKWQQLHVRLF